MMNTRKFTKLAVILVAAVAMTLGGYSTASAANWSTVPQALPINPPGPSVSSAAATNKFVYRPVHIFSGSDLDGEIVLTDNTPSSWRYIAPGTGGAVHLEAVCERPVR